MSVELLTAGEDGRAVEGLRFPDDAGSVVRYLPQEWESTDDARIAYRHRFFARAPDGTPIPESTVDYYVPTGLLEDGAPTPRAMRLVEQRQGWDRIPEPGEPPGWSG